MTPEEVASAALACPSLVRAIRLAEWVGGNRELTSTGVLRPAVAVQACQALGIALPPGKLRSAKDVADLNEAWEVAVAANLVLVAANRAAAAPDAPVLARVADGTAELGPESAERIALAWLNGAAVPLGFPGDPCGECLSVLHALRESAAPVSLNDLVSAVIADAGAGAAPSLFDDLGTYVCPDCGRRHSAPTVGVPGLGDVIDGRALELAEHATSAVHDLVQFGAAAIGPGRAPGGAVTLTSLGRLLAESVLHSVSPAADVTAADLIESVAWLPPAVARTAAAPWLAARNPVAAVGELLAFAESFSGPMLRFIAIEIARSVGSDGAPAWREVAKRPGFGAYARQWLTSQREPVTADDRDEVWLLVDTVAQVINKVSGGLEALVLAAALRELTGGDFAGHIADIRDCGHPKAAEVAGLLSGRLVTGGGTGPAVTLLPSGTRAAGGAVGYPAEAADSELFQLKVTLRDVSKPPVWRRVLVPATMTLGELHEVIVRAMGWHGGHLHVFSDGMAEYGMPDPELGHQDEDSIELDEVLSGPGDRLSYTYDFGDDWDHDVKLEKVLPPDAAATVPACLAGKGACPPEDCGGAWGYAELKEAIADPAHEERQELLEWLGLDDPADFDAAAFDLDYANARVRRAGSMPSRTGW